LYLVPLTAHFGAEGTIIALILTESCNTLAFVVAFYRSIKPPSEAKPRIMPVSVPDE
jgi:hypothetical protein